ncbi:hypothetical protein [Macrococcus animalis]|uniref:hypothetical protein n=1 Tax=Macrococcus animalis TaxID=3395467 RepID=UPI0039BE81D9
MAKKHQSNRLTEQHKLSLGVLGIFNEQAKDIDKAVGEISKFMYKTLLLFIFLIY